MGVPDFGKGGGSGGGNKNRNTPDQTLSRYAQQLFEESDPTRRALFDRTNTFLSNPNEVFSQPGYAAVKDATESQYGRARENIIGSTPEGGALSQNLADLEQARASDLVRGTAQLNETELQRAMTLGTGTTGQSLGGLGSAGAIQAQREASDDAQKGAKAGALGTGAGAYFGSK